MDAKFSVALRSESDSESSYVDFGFSDESAMTDPDALQWIAVAVNNVYGQRWWQNYLEGVRFRNSSLSYAESVADADSYGTTTSGVGIFAITDTASSCISLPTYLYEFVILELFDYVGVTYTSNGWGYVFNCDEADLLPNIDLLYGGFWLEMLVDDYVVNLGDDICTFCIRNYGSGFAVLGDALLRNYYVIHDMDSMYQGFVPLANS